jgi:hypothetical protein
MPGRLQKSITSKPGEIVTPSEQSSVFRTLPFPHVGIFTFRPVFRFDGRFGNGTILDYGGSRWRGEDGLQGSEIVVVFVVTRQDLLDKAFRFGERQTRHDWVVFGLLSIFTGHSQRLALPRAWLKRRIVSYRHEMASMDRETDQTPHPSSLWETPPSRSPTTGSGVIAPGLVFVRRSHVRRTVGQTKSRAKPETKSKHPEDQLCA